MIEAHLTSPTSITCGDVALHGKSPVTKLCRHLVKQGDTGRMLVYGTNGNLSLRVDVEKAAKITYTERDRDGIGRCEYAENPFANPCPLRGGRNRLSERSGPPLI